MSFITDAMFNMMAYLPKLCSWWMYKPKRTKEEIKVGVSAQSGSVEVWCDKEQAHMSVYVEFTNNNPFPIDIDRCWVSGSIHTAQMKALNLVGTKIPSKETGKLLVEGPIDEVNRRRVKTCPPAREEMRLVVNAIIINKYHIIRDFSHAFDCLMCRLINKNIEE